jgi:hypothetical protein
MGLNKTEYHKYRKSTYQRYVRFEAITANTFTGRLLLHQTYQWNAQNQSFRDLLPLLSGSTPILGTHHVYETLVFSPSATRLTAQEQVSA